MIQFPFISTIPHMIAGFLAFLEQFCPSASDTNPVSLPYIQRDAEHSWCMTTVQRNNQRGQGNCIRPDQTAMRWLVMLPFSFFIANQEQLYSCRNIPCDFLQGWLRIEDDFVSSSSLKASRKKRFQSCSSPSPASSWLSDLLPFYASLRIGK